MAIEKILIVDDEQLNRDFLAETLKRKDFDIKTCPDGKTALQYAEKEDYDLVITDMRMDGMSGLELLEQMAQLHPGTMVVIMTAYGTIENAVKAMKLGAVDYLLKPFNPEDIELLIEKLDGRSALIQENIYLKRELSSRYDFSGIIGVNPSIREVFENIKKIANTRSTVLIWGESGTGKELAAMAIHNWSVRKNKPFIKVNCAALPESLLESELFGHEKGAFTGAVEKRLGRFELADKGTILLDEISEMPLKLQTKLLRVLQEREFERVGGVKTIKIDVRVICITNKNLHELVKKGDFREDLLYRLNVIPIKLLPLRERSEDIPALMEHFAAFYAKENGKTPQKFSAEAVRLFTQYPWPGNIRELQNIVERIVVMDFDPVKAVRSIMEESNCVQEAVPAKALPETIAQMEKRVILATLDSCAWNRTRAAKILDISVRTLRNKLHLYKIEDGPSGHCAGD